MLSIKHHSLNDTFHDHKANAGIAANDKNEEELHELLIEGYLILLLIFIITHELSQVYGLCICAYVCLCSQV